LSFAACINLRYSVSAMPQLDGIAMGANVTLKSWRRQQDIAQWQHIFKPHSSCKP
jgi:hypothetical protein